MASTPTHPRLVPWRRLSQGLALVLFFFLFLKTDYTGSDQIEYAVNILFRLDPLLAACAMLAAKMVVTLMLPALALLALTLLLGRFFCGWACPMGALLDLTHPLLKPRHREPDSRWPHLPLLLLAFLLAGSFFGLPVAGYLDPFSLLVRGLSLAVYPAFTHATTVLFTWTYREAPAWVNFLSEPVYAGLKATVLPLSQKYHEQALLAAALLLTVFLLELGQRRFFCRNLCPLGGLLGLSARGGLLRGHGGDDTCGRCRACRMICRTGAIAEDRRIAMERCILCLDCRDLCPRGVIAFRFRRPEREPLPLSLSRRGLLAALAGGALLPAFTAVRGLAKAPDPLLIRPPGALAEEEFLGRCVRCGECMKVCIGNALHPTLLEAGIEGIFSPRLAARLGYCEFNCTLCGQVCPSGAIRALPLPEKQVLKIGHAFFDRDRCLPYAKGIPCMVCEEHCPTPDKAIRFRPVTVVNDQDRETEVLQPYVVDHLCIGCGICEHKCPLPDRAAIFVTAAGEARHPDRTLPAAGTGYP